MSRDLHPDFLAELRKRQITPVLFFEGEFATSTERLWTGVGDIEWDGKTWKGVAGFIGMGQIEETTEVKATGVSVQLNGIKTEYLQRVLDEARQGKPGKIWIAALDAQGRVIGNPYLAFAGRLDVPKISRDGKTASVTITYENHLIDLARPRARYYTDEEQKLDYPDDRGFEYIAGMQDKVITWGRG